MSSRTREALSSQRISLNYINAQMDRNVKDMVKDYLPMGKSTKDVKDKENRCPKQKVEVVKRQETPMLAERQSDLLEQYTNGDRNRKYRQLWQDIYEDIKQGKTERSKSVENFGKIRKIQENSEDEDILVSRELTKQKSSTIQSKQLKKSKKCKAVTVTKSMFPDEFTYNISYECPKNLKPYLKALQSRIQAVPQLVLPAGQKSNQRHTQDLYSRYIKECRLRQQTVSRILHHF